MPLIFKIESESVWREAVATGWYAGADVDRSDGFVHFSTAQQITETAQRHFRGRAGLLAVAFEASDFGDRLVWEPSRGGALFPHLYPAAEGARIGLDPTRALWTMELPLGSDGVPIIPDRILAC
ncbi:MAG: DUF952 domain-containing protein [Hyphomicrobiaceae bacterium]|nr:DUF952 domain-containing protein [Hyphomicrobiaceae bacterium]